MAKFLTIDPSQITAAKRQRIQAWIFSTGEPYLTKKVDDADVPIENASEVTAEHIEKYLTDNIKVNVYEFERTANAKSFEESYPNLNL